MIRKDDFFFGILFITKDVDRECGEKYEGRPITD